MALQHLHVVPVEGEACVLHRVVTTDDRESADFIECFKSSAELGQLPRKGSPEERFSLIHTGVSLYKTRRQAERVATRWGKGNYIAEVRVEPDQGICLAAWGSKGHVTVWGDPVKLAGMTVDIVSVGQEP